MLIPIIAFGAGAIGGYLLGRNVPDSRLPLTVSTAGPIYSIGLSNTPAVSGRAIGEALVQAMGWKLDDIFDGDLNAEGTVLTIAFKNHVTSPAMPGAGFVFKVGDVPVTVTFVAQAPANVRFP